MIDIPNSILEEVCEILQAHVPECEVRVFGSRVRGTARRYSDLDLALVAPERIPQNKLESLKDAFSESDLPILVDVLDWNTISPSFQQCINTHYELLQIK